MGRPPAHGAPSFRFHASEVAEMENILREHAGQVPNKDFLVSLATKFSNTPDRAGKSIVQMKQVWNWFQNRRYALRAKLVKSPGNSNMPPNPQGDAAPVRNVPPVHQQTSVPLGHNLVRNASENPPMEFEAKSARDGAWYDVQEFLSQRNFEANNPEVLVRFAGFGQEEDEWVDVLKHVRHRSLPCESTECLIVIPGDLILCFQEGKEQALYFDAHVLDAQRRRHDVRGCRCRFLVRYDHDQSEEIVPLRKICRRPETDYRLQLLNSANESAAVASVVTDSKRPAADSASSSSLRVPNSSANPPVAFSSHTIVNPSVGVPKSALSPAMASTSAPAPAPSFTIPSQSLTSGPAQAPAPASVLALASAPGQAQASAPPQAQAQAQAPVLAATPSQAPVLAQTAAQAPVLAPNGAPASGLTTTPSVNPMSAATQSSTPIPSPDPSLTSSSAPSVIPAVNSGSTMVTAPAPSPTPVQVPSLIPVRAPGAESDNPATSSTGEADIIMNSNGASMVMEDKSIAGTCTVVTGGSSVLQGETSENPAPEKVESIIAPSEPSTAPMEGGPSVS